MNPVLSSRLFRPSGSASPLLFLLSFSVLGVAAAQTPDTSAGTMKLPPKAGKNQVKLGTVYVPPAPGLLLFNQALEATRKKKYAEAERLYRKVVKMEPTAAAAWANLGILLGYQGRNREAIDSLKTATRVSPQTGGFWAQLSTYELQAKLWKDSEASARKAIARDPENPLALANLGDTLFQQKRYAEAVPVLKKLAALEGKTPRDHTDITLILALSGAQKHGDALIRAQKRRERLPKDPNAWLLLGDTARRAGDLMTAQQSYSKALTLDPKNVGAQGALSAVAALQGDTETALKWLKERLVKTPRDAALNFQAGYLLYSDLRRKEQERCEEAETYFRRAVTYDPKNPLYLTYTGIALMLQGPFPHLPPNQDPGARQPYANATTFLKAALAVSPRYTTARLALANVSERSNKPEEALAHYKAILSYDDNDIAAHRGIAGIFYATGKKEDAYQKMEEIARRQPQDTRTLSELASWLVQDRQTSRAKNVYTRIIQRNPGEDKAYIALGRLLEQEGKPDAAREQYETALRVIPTSVEATLILGNLLSEQNKKEQALGVYRTFLQADPSNNLVRWYASQVLRELQRYDEALAEIQALTLRRDDPNRTTYLLGAPQLLIERGHYGEAIRELLRLQQENPTVDEIRYTLATAYEKSGQPDKAESTLRELVERPPDLKQPLSVRPRLALAGLYERAEKWDDAAARYEDTLRSDPLQQLALQSLSRIREKQGKPQAAMEFLEGLVLMDEKEPYLNAIGAVHQLAVQNKALGRYREFTARLVAKYPENRVAQYVRARSLTEESPEETARQEAVAIYQSLVQKNPRDVEAWNQLALELEALKRPTEAIAAYRSLLKVNPADSSARSALARLEKAGAGTSR